MKAASGVGEPPDNWQSVTGRKGRASVATGETRPRSQRPTEENSCRAAPAPPAAADIKEAPQPAAPVLPETAASAAASVVPPPPRGAVFPANNSTTQRLLDSLRRAAEAVETHVVATADTHGANIAHALLQHHAARLAACVGGGSGSSHATALQPTKAIVSSTRWADEVEAEDAGMPIQSSAQDCPRDDAAVLPPAIDGHVTPEPPILRPPPWTTVRDWTAVLGTVSTEPTPRSSRSDSSGATGATGSGASSRTTLTKRLDPAQVRRATQVVEKLARRSSLRSGNSADERATPLIARLARAQEKRDAHLRTVVQKATQESLKVGEVAFIAGLEASNRKLAFEAKLRSSESRRQSVIDARKAAAAAAASQAVDEATSRRRKAEAERNARLSASLEAKEAQAQALAAERAAEAERVAEAAAAERARREDLRALEAAAAARKAAAIEERLVEAASRRSAHLAARSAGTLSPRSSDCGGGVSATWSGALSPPRLGTHPHVWNHDEGGAAEQAGDDGPLTLVLPPRARSSSPRSGNELTSPRRGRASTAASSPGIIAGGLSAALALDFNAAERAAADAAAAEADAQRTAKRIKRLRSKIVARVQPWPSESSSQQSGGLSAASHATALKAMTKLAAMLGKQQGTAVDVATANECFRVASADASPSHVARQTGFLTALAAAATTAVGTLSAAPRSAEPLVKALLAATAAPSNMAALLCSDAMLSLVDPLLNHITAEAAAARSHPGSRGVSAPTAAVCAALCRLFARALTPQKLAPDDIPSALAEVIASQAEDLAELLIHMRVLHCIRDIICFGDKPIPGEELPALYSAALAMLNALIDRVAPPVGTAGSAAGAALVTALRDTAFAGVFAFLADILLKGRRARTSTTSGGLSPTTGSPPSGTSTAMSLRALPSNFDAVATTALRCVSSAARVQRDAWQAMVGSPGLRAEVTLVSSAVLGHCAAAGSADATLTSTRDVLLDEAVLFLGLFASKSANNAAILRWGPPPTLLQRLVALPLRYFTDTACRHVLLPTLLAACVTGPADDGHNLQVVAQDLALSALEEYLDELDGAQSTVPQGRFAPSSRFGHDMWAHAKTLLVTKQQRP